MTRCRRLLARLSPAAAAVALGVVACAEPPPPPATTRGPASGAGETAAPVPVAAAGAGEPAVLYDASYALVIGAGNYEHWSRLTNVENEVREVANALRRRDFDVATLMDPTEGELRRTAEEFIYRYGYDPGNRLVLFFSGHGYTLDGHGYIVPVDAPDPTLDERGFAQTAIDMLDIMAWARKVRAKHALFAFDSCFAGTLFETKSLPDPTDAYVRGNIGRPVRQFITAGDAGQEVPAKSIFTPLFIRGLDGAADYTKDGYVTGSELGLFLMQTVPDYGTGQTPQYGKIRDPDLDEGDVVFRVGPAAPPEPEPTPPEPEPARGGPAEQIATAAPPESEPARAPPAEQVATAARPPDVEPAQLAGLSEDVRYRAETRLRGGMVERQAHRFTGWQDAPAEDADIAVEREDGGRAVPGLAREAKLHGARSELAAFVLDDGVAAVQHSRLDLPSQRWLDTGVTSTAWDYLRERSARERGGGSTLVDGFLFRYKLVDVGDGRGCVAFNSVRRQDRLDGFFCRPAGVPLDGGDEVAELLGRIRVEDTIG